MITIDRNRLPIDIYTALPAGLLRKSSTSGYYSTIFFERMLGPRLCVMRGQIADAASNVGDVISGSPMKVLKAAGI